MCKKCWHNFIQIKILMPIRLWSKYSCQVRVFSIRAMSFLYLIILLFITSESYALSQLQCEALFELNKIKHKLRVDLNLHNGVRNLENVELNRTVRHKIKFTALINDPKFVELVQSLALEYQEATLNAAKYFSLEQLIAIAIEGQGFQWLQLKRRCPHCCIGCTVRSDKNNSPSKTMKWEDFTNVLYALKGLEDVLNKSEYHLNILNKKSKQQASKFKILANRISPFWDSEPTVTILTDKLGNKHGLYEILKTIYEITGKRSSLVTTGWASNGVIEDDMKRIVKDILNKNGNYLAPDYEISDTNSKNSANLIYFQIKLLTQPFIHEFNKFLHELLKNNSQFQYKFGKDFIIHKLDFQKYHNKEEVYHLYESILMANIDKLFQNSKYLMDRIKNIQTLMPIIQSKDIKIYFVVHTAHFVNQAIKAGVPSSILPLIEEAGALRTTGLFKSSFKDALFFKINNLYLNSLLQNNHIEKREWSFKPPIDIDYALGTGIVFVDGGIGFSGHSEGMLNKTFAAMYSIPLVSDLLDQPVFAYPDPSLQQRIFLSYNRIVTTRVPILTEVVLEDIETFLKSQYPGQRCVILEVFASRYHRKTTTDMRGDDAVISDGAYFDGVAIGGATAKQTTSEILAVPVRLDSTQYLFSLRNGKLYNPDNFSKNNSLDNNRPIGSINNFFNLVRDFIF